jgi:divalent metal cation (Fe/Co/Zn/Cd) transporter
MNKSGRASMSPKAAIEIGYTVLVAAVFGVSGYLYLRIGVENLFHSLTFPGKVIGAVLFMCSIVILAGAPAILRYQQLAWRSDATRYQYLVFGSDAMLTLRPPVISIQPV